MLFKKKKVINNKILSSLSQANTLAFRPGVPKTNLSFRFWSYAPPAFFKRIGLDAHAEGMINTFKLIP